jgi:long-chain acyl-CoA synthetase
MSQMSEDERIMTTIKEAVRNLLYPASSRPQFKDKAAIIQASGQGAEDEIISFAQFEALVDLAHATLLAQGIARQDTVMLTAPNCPQLAAAIVATWRLGAVAVPVDFRLTVPEVINVAKQISAKALVASSGAVADFAKTYGEVVENGCKLIDLTKFSGQNKTTEKDVLAALDLDQPALIILTSGTTGMPKGAVHDLGSLVKNLLDLIDLVSMTENKKGLLPLPLSHVFGLEVTYVCIICGACVVFTDPAAPKSFFTCLPKYKPQILVGVPTLYSAMLSMDPKTVGLDNAEILLSGGAPVPPSLSQEFQGRFNKMINNGYGSTESKIIALNLDGPFESVGRSIPTARIDIVNDKDEVLPEGQTGEIRISGPMLMKGYLNNQ